jgi:hypothetical protein
MEEMTPKQYVLKILWILVRLGLALSLMNPGKYFYYQGF